MLPGGPVPVFKKYTVGSKGIWEKLRVLLAIAPNRSSGNPIVPLYRVPTPGSRPEAQVYQDPSSYPTNDIAENPYWKRDHRRAYPQTAFFDQKTVTGLLELGSEATPRIADGDAGTKALLNVANGGVSLNQAITKSPKDVIYGEVLTVNGLPPVAPTLAPKQWKIIEGEAAIYPKGYPCRTFH
ncbi:NADH-ubiquinone oxidoreductase 21.3 kDa subunit [Yarrowia sp. B02]|nr:NADH-ubiquinone oxidoreductase 21.3 kDa subunit [Yarrowia sp. B02]